MLCPIFPLTSAIYWLLALLPLMSAGYLYRRRWLLATAAAAVLVFGISLAAVVDGVGDVDVPCGLYL
jgi:hypothetical protein